MVSGAEPIALGREFIFTPDVAMVSVLAVCLKGEFDLDRQRHGSLRVDLRGFVGATAQTELVNSLDSLPTW